MSIQEETICLVVVGAAGIGKTDIAMHATHGAAEHGR